MGKDREGNKETAIDGIYHETANALSQATDLYVLANEKCVAYLGHEIPEIEPGSSSSTHDGTIEQIKESLSIIQSKLSMISRFVAEI